MRQTTFPVGRLCNRSCRFFLFAALWLWVESLLSPVSHFFPWESGLNQPWTFGQAIAVEPPSFPDPTVELVNEPAAEASPADSAMMDPQLDPLDSPYPVPWNWVMANLSESSSLGTPALRYYRSPSLVSPDGQYAAYSRIQMVVQPNFVQSRVGSVLFLENLRTGDLQTITAASPFADNPFLANPQAEREGTIAIIVPVAWSEGGDRVLAREFESLFGTDIASDYAVIWDRDINRTQTIAPSQVQYSNAVLLGWSQSHPDQVLFRAGSLGDEQWPLWAVDSQGQTIAATDDDQPMTFGRVVNNVWSGPQAYYR